MIRLFRQGFALAALLPLLFACGTFTLPKTYVLGDLPQPTPGVTDEAGLPHLELKRVTVPGYLDTTDMVRRSATNQVIVSPTGRWAERVSVGITHALAIDLAERLPHMVIESEGAYEPRRRLFVDVERFEIAQDGRCTLTARWRVTDANGKVAADSEQDTFVVAARSGADADVTVAMTSAVDQLAARIASTAHVQSL